MQCSLCEKKVVFKSPSLCSKHFVEYFEDKVQDTIREQDLIPKGSRVCVAASGGKDSLTLLYLLHKFGYDVEALAIDEGIADYREHSLKDLKTLCEDNNITLTIIPFSSLINKDLDDVMKEKIHACTVCGTLRRKIMNDHAQKYDLIATGHNADDEAQAILMNLFRAQTQMLFRSGPSTNKQEGFTPRIKPLYFCTEKEILTYALIKGYKGEFTECPYAKAAYRERTRAVINDYTTKNPQAKNNVLKKYLSLRKTHKHPTRTNECVRCGAPTPNKTCSACTLIQVHKK